MSTSLYVDNWYEVYEVTEHGNKLLGWNVYSIPAGNYRKEMTEADSEDATPFGPIFKPTAKVVTW